MEQQHTPLIDETQPAPTYNFEFTRVSNYYGTTVSITALLPFTKLHLLYALPALILRAYWQAIKTQKHAAPVTKIEQLEKLQSHFNDEKEAIESIESLTSHVDIFKEGFPFRIYK